MRALPRLMSVAAALLLASCQIATPASRIEQNPALFSALPEKDKALVQQGEIRTGMSVDAVFLAWGYPNSRPFVGEKGGRRVERWVYTRMEAVTAAPGWGEPCSGADCCCHGRTGANTVYIPRNTAEVVFENGKVVSWETLQ